MSHTLDLIKYLHDGAMVITPNNRLAQQLLRAYDTHYRPEKDIVVKPLCFPYLTFLQILFQKIKHAHPHQNHPILLSTQQAHHLWKYILTKKKVDFSQGLLNTVFSAWDDCQAWRISDADLSPNSTIYTRQFQTWSQEYQKELTSRNAITLQQIPNYLIEAVFPMAPTPIIWTCFDEFTPIQRALQDYLQQHHCPSHYDDFEPKITSTYCFPAKDQSDEYQQMLIWLKTRLDQGDRHIAIVVPDLRSEADPLQRLLAQSFAEEDYNISYGRSLNEYPVVNTALQWLALDLKQIHSQQIELLLQSPFINAGQTEFTERSQLLQSSTLMRVSTLPWSEFLSCIAAKAPKLHASLQDLNPYPENDSPQAWTLHFRDRLERLGFPGEGPILSSLYQCIQRFILLLDELMSLTVISPQMSLSEALHAIFELSQNIIFQIKKPSSPISVLGMLEASGCHFDSMWVTGLTDQCFPQKTKFSPLLSINLQKTYLMPHTCAQREFIRAQMVLNRFAYASNRIVYSFPKMLGDQPQLPSFLIKDFLHLPSTPVFILNKPTALEAYEESYSHPPIAIEQLSGGTSLLSQQAKCPFQAFATHRLKIRPIPEKTDGFDLMERGQILHRILELIWKKLDTQSKLLNISADELEQIIHPIITKNLDQFGQKCLPVFPLLAQVEYQRIKQLVYASLEWEKQRAPFVVESLEGQYHITLSSIPFKVRIDRLDRLLNSSSKIVIDYKTSLPAPLPWRENRPEASQLLLYALLDSSIHTLLFMQLKAGHMNLNGFSAYSMLEKGISTLKDGETWSQYQTFWQQQLETLALEIKQGHCAPMPKRASVCQQCSFQSLCRITT